MTEPRSKRSAPGREITGAAKLRLVQRYQQCSHSATVSERMPEGHTHHAREVCADCGAFIHWLPKPETLVRQRLNVFRLAKLGMCSGLTEWESRFVADMSTGRKVSPRQQSIIDELCDKHLKGAAA